jgi:tetratricopeptide (TPR) repeat protein
VQLLELLLAVRNRGPGHGAIPTEAESPVVEVCRSLESACDRAAKLTVIVPLETVSCKDCPGEFVQRGILYEDEKQLRWEEKRGVEDLLELRQMHYLDKEGLPCAGPPFVQTEANSLWMLLKYRGEADSFFTDFRSASPRKDTYWSKYVRDFFEGRFERAGKTAIQQSATGVFHSLPPETDLYPKFVGRGSDLSSLVDRLSVKRQTHIVALGGVGGVGKTALARFFAESVVNAPDGERTFDYVVWVSAKTSMLADEVKPLTPGFENIEDLLDHIARVADSPQLIYLKPIDRKKGEVADLLANGRFLIIVDNFETVKNKGAFWNFLLEVPAPTKVLVTSRELSSEGCVTIELREVGAKEALQIFANECENLGLGTKSILSKRQEKAIIERTGGVPLALKHIAIMIHRGVTFDQAIERLGAKSGPLAEFCFRQTFTTLGQNEKTVWLAMGLFQRPIWPSELTPVTTIPEEEVRSILNTLKTYSIVNRSLDDEGYETFSCLPLTLEFAKKELETWPGSAEMAHRYRQYRLLFSRAAIKKEGSGVARIAKETGVVHPMLLAQELARRALSCQREGDTAQAFELIAEAEKIYPKEKSIWETKAEIQLAEGQYEAARETLVRLIDTSPYDVTILRKLAYLEKFAGQWSQAVDYARKVTNLPTSTKKDWHILGTMYYKKAYAEKEQGEHLKKEESLLDAIECFRVSLVPKPISYEEKKHNIVVCDTLARTYMHLHKYDDAERTIMKGLELDPENHILQDLQKELTGRATSYGRSGTG